jgi:hypothetical protein
VINFISNGLNIIDNSISNSVVLKLLSYDILYAVYDLALIGLLASTNIAAGNVLIIFVNETNILLFKEPNNDLFPLFLDVLNLTLSVLLGVDCVATTSSSFKSSNVKKSENAEVTNSLLSFSGITTSNAKLVFVSWLVPSVI